MSKIKIPFNKPYFTGKEITYIKEAVNKGHLSGNGYFTKKCQSFFEEKYGFEKCLLTTSCTDALEMCSILANVNQGDEVIMPSYTFTSTANAFVLRGANIVFADSRPDHPGIDESKIERLITEKTKAIVIVHYAGVACDMEIVMNIANKHNIIVIEDAAQAIESYYHDRPLGSFGHMAAFSFHETKNISSGEGGMLVVNDKRFSKRAEIIWEKGTNRAAFFRGEVDKYGWVDMGSSFLPSEIIAAVLCSQLEMVQEIQNKRISLWEKYYNSLQQFDHLFKVPTIPEYATNNAHMFYLVFKEKHLRDHMMNHLKENGILAVFHYQSLHRSDFHESQCTEIPDNPLSDFYTEHLLRLPLFYDLEMDIDEVIKNIKSFSLSLEKFTES